MNTGLIALIIIVLAGGGFWLATSGAPEMDDAMMQKDEMMEKDAMESDSMMEKDAAMEGDAMMQKDEMMEKESMNDEAMMKDDAMMEKDAMMQKETMMHKGTIEAYSPEKLAMAESGKVLLFFHAAWCPICRSLDAQAAANGFMIPDGVHVLKVDFDTALDLRKKYGVTVQHTFVQVDASGASLGKWSDASTYSQVFARVK